MSKDRIKTFFNIYAQNFSIIRQNTKGLIVKPEIDDVFLCPMCFDKYFNYTDVEADLLSLEHLPPATLGGSVKTITCKGCNNWAGTKLDSQLLHMLKFVEFWVTSSNSHQEIKYSLNESPFLPATLSRLETGELLLLGSPQRTNPHDLQQLYKGLNGNTAKKLNFKITFRPYKNRHPEAALLRIAYLMAFSTLGYSFLINPCLRVIRGQIFNPTEHILPHWGITDDELPNEALGIHLVTKPNELQSFLIVFDLRTPNGFSNRYGVLMPGPSAPGLKIYQYLNEKGEKFKINQNCIKISSEINFVNFPFATYDIWNEWRAG